MSRVAKPMRSRTQLASLALLRGLGAALVAGVIALTAPVSAQTSPHDEWAAELAWIEASAARLDLEGTPEAALDLLEGMPTAALVDDRHTTRRMIRVAESLHAPGAEPQWFYVGLPLTIGGVLGFLVTGLVNLGETSCGFAPGCMRPDPDLTPFIVGYVFAGGAVLTGLVLNIIGLVTHTADPVRRAFEQRRQDVIRGFVDARRGVGVRW